MNNKALIFGLLLLLAFSFAQNYTAITLANQSFCDNFGDGGSCDRGYNANWVQIATMEADETWSFSSGNGGADATNYKEGTRGVWANDTNTTLGYASHALVSPIDLSGYSNITLWIKMSDWSLISSGGTVLALYSNASNSSGKYKRIKYNMFPISIPTSGSAWYYLNAPLSLFEDVSEGDWSHIEMVRLFPNTINATAQNGTFDDLRAVGASGQFNDTMNNVVRWTPTSGVWEIQNVSGNKVLRGLNKSSGDNYFTLNQSISQNSTIYVDTYSSASNSYVAIMIGGPANKGVGRYGGVVYCLSPTTNETTIAANGEIVTIKIITNATTFSAYYRNSTASDFSLLCSNLPYTSSGALRLYSNAVGNNYLDNILIQSHIPPANNTTDNSGTFTREQSLECSALTNSSDGETVCDWYQNGTINQTAKRMVAYYPFDAPYSNSTFTQDMAITPTANATVSGATWTSNGKVGGAYSFDGVNDAINISDNVKLNFSTGDYTISAWVKTGIADANARQIIRKKGAGAGDGYDLYYQSNNIYSRLDGTTASYLMPSLANNEWHQITTTASRATLTLSIFVDGTYRANASINLTQSASYSDILSIGGYSGGQYWNGSIDDVRIYNQSLTADEIGQIYRDGMIGKTLLENTATFKTKWYSKSVSATTQQSQNVTSISLATATLFPPTITPSLAHLNDTLTCNAGTFTQSDDVENVSARTWQWFINGAASVTTQTLAAGTFAITDEILCGETATGLYWGDTASAVSSEAQVISIFYTTYTMPNTTGFGSAFDYSRTVMTTATGYSFAFELMMIGTIFMCFYIIGSRYTQERALVYSTFLTLIVAFLMVSGNFLNPMWLILLIIALLVSIYLAGRIG
jgi:hypothetical protein